MEKTQMIKWAMKGLDSEIENLEKEVRKGERIIKSMVEGDGYYKGVLTQHEVQAKIYELKAEIENLFEQKNQLRWELVK